MHVTSDRVKTYVQGFDEVLGGGIPRGEIVLIAGTPGTMKTSLAFSIVYNNVKHDGARALYISLEEGHDDLKAAMAGLGMTGVDDLELYVLDVSKIRLEHKEEELEKNWLDILPRYIEQRVTTNRFDLVVVDSLSALYSLSKMDHPRRDLFHFIGFLRSLGATTFLLAEVPSGNDGRIARYDEDFLVDGVLVLRHFEVGATDVQLRIRCVKMRRTKHAHGYFALLRTADRFLIKRATPA